MADRSSATAAGRPDVLEIDVVAGAAKETNIAVSGIRRGVDRLKSVVEVEKDTGKLTDRTAEASVTSDGNIQLSTNSTAEDQLLVFWYRRA